MNDHKIIVDGLDTNDINYRGEFSFGISDKTELVYQETEILISDLRIGDTVVISFIGSVQETYPVKIPSDNIMKIELLED